MCLYVVYLYICMLLIYRRCSNRVVEKGMNTYRLEIFLINDGDSKRKRKRKKKMIIRKNHINDSSSSSKIDDDDDGNGDADIQEDSIWGVRTLDFIPQNAFICEVVGQYVYGSSKPLPPTPSLHESVAVESLLSSSSSSSSSSSPSSYSSSSSRIYDILPQKSSSSITDILLSTSSSYTTSDGDNNNDDDDLKSSNRIIPVNMWEKNTIYPVNEWVLNQMNKDPTIDDDLNTNSSFSSLIDKEYDAIKSYLNGQLCVSPLFYCIFTDYVNIYSSNNLLSEIIYKQQLIM